MNIETKLGNLSERFRRRFYSEYDALCSGKRARAARPTEANWVELLQLQCSVAIELLTTVKSLAALHRRLLIWERAEQVRLIWLLWQEDKEGCTGDCLSIASKQAHHLHILARRNLFARQKAARQDKTTSAAKVLQ